MARHRFKSVWDAIEPSAEEATNMRLRAELMNRIRDRIAARKTTQAVAARGLGITQPRLNDLLRGRIDKFSLDALVEMAGRAGLSVRLNIDEAA